MKYTLKTRAITIVVLSSFILTGSFAIVFAQTATTQSPLPPTATAQAPAPQSTFTLQNPLKVNSISDIILTFMQIASYLAVLFAVLALVYVGLQFVLARGNSERMKELSKWLLYIVIGVAIILGARILISVIINTLSATGTVNPSIIQNAQNAINKQ